LKKEEPKCYTLTLAPLYLDFKLKSNRVSLKLKMDPGPRKKSSDPGPGRAMPAARYSKFRAMKSLSHNPSGAMVVFTFILPIQS
jgi:hypothetical protein